MSDSEHVKIALPSAGAELVAAVSAQATTLMFAALASPVVHEGWVGDAALAAVGLLGLTTVVAGVTSWARRRARIRSIDRAGEMLTVDGVERLDTRTLRDVELHDRGRDGARVRLIDAHDRVAAQVELESADEAQRLIERLGLDRSDRARELGGVARKAAFSMAAHRALALASLTIIVALLMARPTMAASVVSAGLASLALLVQRGIRVGRDGVQLRSWRGQVRFVPYMEVLAVEREGLAVSLRLADGTAVEVLPARGRGDVAHQAHVTAVAKTLERALDAARESARDPSTLAALLARGARTEAAWRDEVRALARGADYRTPAPTREALEELLASVSAAPDVRIGAAIALRARSADGEPLRDAAARVAHPQVRVALEALADDDEDTIEESLRALR